VAAEYGRSIHDYVPMANYVHLLVKLRAGDNSPGTMQPLTRRHVRPVNARISIANNSPPSRFRP
jgi:hypothetical protein